MGALDTGGDRQRGRGSSGENVGCPIVTNGEFVAKWCESDALFPNYFDEDLFS